jgi:LysM repeat protein
VVKPGDTPSGIAEKTGVSLEQLEKANPDLDPQLLAPGQRIRIPR